MQEGTINNVEEKYIDAPKDTQNIVIFRNIEDGLYYGKKPDNTIEVINSSLIPIDLTKILNCKFRYLEIEGVLEFNKLYLKNFDSSPTMQRISIGQYKIINDSNEFNLDKIFISGSIVKGTTSLLIPIGDLTSLNGYVQIIISDENNINVNSLNSSFNLVEISDLIGSNWFCIPEIKIFN